MEIESGILPKEAMSSLSSDTAHLRPCPLLSDPNIRKLISYIGDWWDTPASRSGQWHKPGQTQWGHAVGVLNNSVILWQVMAKSYYDFTAPEPLFVAALFHDVGKMVNSEEHDYWSGEWLVSRGYEDAGEIAAQHMGKWGSYRASRIRRIAGTTAFFMGEVLHIADYLDAMQHFRETPACRPDWRELK